MIKTIHVEGIGQVYAQKLTQVNINSIERFLKLATPQKGREEISARAGISEILISEWVNPADLMRIKGTIEKYSDLQEEAGNDTVKKTMQT